MKVQAIAVIAIQAFNLIHFTGFYLESTLWGLVFLVLSAPSVITLFFILRQVLSDHALSRRKAVLGYLINIISQAVWALTYLFIWKLDAETEK